MICHVGKRWQLSIAQAWRNQTGCNHRQDGECCEACETVLSYYYVTEKFAPHMNHVQRPLMVPITLPQCARRLPGVPEGHAGGHAERERRRHPHRCDARMCTSAVPLLYLLTWPIPLTLYYRL
jgi:hypothetical protein